MVGQVAVAADTAAPTVRTEKWWPGPSGLKRRQQRPRRNPAALAQDAGELLHRRRVKERGQRDATPGGPLDGRQQMGREERVAAEIEEVIPPPDRPNSERALPDLAELEFQGVGRGHESGARVG